MFNLMVSAADDVWEQGAYIWDRERIFEHTAAHIREPLAELTVANLETLLSLPTLFMYERGVKGQPRTGRLKRIQRSGSKVRIVFELDPLANALTFEKIEECKWDLGLHDFEFTRVHWAVKGGDLHQILVDNGVAVAQPPLAVDEPPAKVIASTKVFLVHGRDEAAKQSVARFLEQKVGVGVIVLSERPNGGRHLLTKFTEEAEGANYAVVLMTGDDLGRLREGLLPHGAHVDQPKERARQNVIFELGFLLAKFGTDRVCVLQSAGVERPSDYDGIVYVTLDNDDGWKQKLVTELHAANVPVSETWWRAG